MKVFMMSCGSSVLLLSLDSHHARFSGVGSITMLIEVLFDIIVIILSYSKPLLLGHVLGY